MEISSAIPAMEYATCIQIAAAIPIAVYIPATLLCTILFLDTMAKSGPGLMAIKMAILVTVSNSNGMIALKIALFKVFLELDLDYLLFSNHFSLLVSGICWMLKSSNFASKPLPSGEADVIPTITGVWSGK